MLELLALGSDTEAAGHLVSRIGGRLYVHHETESERRPYSFLIRAATDDVEALRAIADYGLHVAYAREVKPGPAESPPERVVASFLLVHHPELSHRQADDHWRDVHGPLALRCHAAMCDYTQLSVVATLAGTEVDGMALCSFATRDELRQRFFNDDEARAEIEADVSSFADVKRSPRRVVLAEVGP